MALIALAAGKGAPGVTTAATALGAVWPRRVLLTECDQAGGDLVYRLPADGGGMLNPATGLLSLAAIARRGLGAAQLAEHTQRLTGGLEVLVGLTSGEQAQALKWLWGPLGRAFAEDADPRANADWDVLADCGRLAPGTPLIDLLREASMIVLFTRATLEQVAHLRERVNGLVAELTGHIGSRDSAPPPPPVPLGIVVIADSREYKSSLQEVTRIVEHAKLPVSVLGGLALDAKGAEMLRGQWGGRIERTDLIRSARQTAGAISAQLTRSSGEQPVAIRGR